MKENIKINKNSNKCPKCRSNFIIPYLIPPNKNKKICQKCGFIFEKTELKEKNIENR